jgi:leader peptidase (prepilin peptidase)/N-methyltransferase
MFSHETWQAVPFHFWSVWVFVFGSMVGSFLNVCIHRMPLGESIVSPPSHCPKCKYAIPWFLNIPLLTWAYLQGKCRNCGEKISARYFLVELLTALLFLACWLSFGRQSVWVALVYAIFLAGLVAATFIDFEHFIIPDEITIGGIVSGPRIARPDFAFGSDEGKFSGNRGRRRVDLFHFAAREAGLWPAANRVGGAD